MAEGFNRLSEVMAKMAEGQSVRHERGGDDKRGVIRVSPSIKWPHLHDKDNDIDAFFDEFDAVTGLANDGQGG